MENWEKRNVCLTVTPHQKTKNRKYCQIHTFSAFLSEMSCFSRTAMLSFRFFTMSAGDLWDFPNGNGMAAATDAFAALCLLHLGTRHKVWVSRSGVRRRRTFQILIGEENQWLSKPVETGKPTSTCEKWWYWEILELYNILYFKKIFWITGSSDTPCEEEHAGADDAGGGSRHSQGHSFGQADAERCVVKAAQVCLDPKCP